MKPRYKKIIIAIIITLILLFLTSCIRIPANYTETGVRNYIKSEKRIRKENREYQRIQNHRKNKIYRLQHQRVEPYKNR